MNRYFKRKEFACKCGCGYDTIDAETLEVITDVRKYFDSPVTITSGCRCTEHNREVGGSENSQHLYARACDVQVKGTSPSIIAAYLDNKYPDKYGIGNYESFTHIDTRANKARW